LTALADFSAKAHNAAMLKTHDIRPKGTFNCPYCGSLYTVSYTHSAFRDTGSAYCNVCNRKMNTWDSTDQPSYTLIIKRDRPK
jgi:transcription elongation factor Elf1